MNGTDTTELTLIRHAPALTGGRLCGRTDVAADLTDGQRIAAVRVYLASGAAQRLIVSPALRCRQTAGALWPDRPANHDPELWEQDFGDWDGLDYSRVPDIGDLAPGALANHRPPGGESFADLCDRIGPALSRIAADGPATIVAHAGTVRAALALATGWVPGALAFDVAPLSVTRVARLSSGSWVIRSVNWNAG